jgi:nitrite reductase/ring-hydroxylating ferredoxin subunit
MHAPTGPAEPRRTRRINVTCPFDGAQFNVCTGAVLRGPAKDPLTTHRVVVDGNVARVELD